jgi:putative flippase GtrA
MDEPTRHILRGSRYLLVAIACAGLHNAIMILLDAAQVHYGISLVISAAVLIPTGYWLQGRVTFAAEHSWASFWRYAMVMIVNTPMSFAALWLLYDKGGLPMWIAAPVSTVLLLIWNYLSSGWALRSDTPKVAA